MRLFSRATGGVLLLCLLFAAWPCAAADSDANGLPAVMEGDIIFQPSLSPQSRAIQIATRSRYSHCGVIFEKNGKPYVFEAILTMSWTPLEAWIRRGVGKEYVLMRLKDRDRVLTPGALDAMKKSAATFEGKSYDLLFQWTDDKIYCSELIWKVYERGAGLELTPLRAIRDYDLDHEEVQQKVRERFGYEIPWDEPAIAPSDLMQSDLLEVVEKQNAAPASR